MAGVNRSLQSSRAVELVALTLNFSCWQMFLVENYILQKPKTTVVMSPHNTRFQSYYKQGALKYKCFIAVFHYLQYHSLHECTWVRPKREPFEKEKLNSGNSTVKHDCALCLYCPARSLVRNAENFAALPGHLNNLVIWDFGHKGLSVVGLFELLQGQESAVFPPGQDLEFGLSDWVMTPLYAALSSSRFNFWCKYWFISNSFCCWFSLVYVSFKSSACWLQYLKRASRITMELLLDTEIGHFIS